MYLSCSLLICSVPSDNPFCQNFLVETFLSVKTVLVLQAKNEIRNQYANNAGYHFHVQTVLGFAYVDIFNDSCSCFVQPNRPDELKRVEAAGGRVINWNGHRILGVLSTSRSIGPQAHWVWVLHERYITCNRKPSRKFPALFSRNRVEMVYQYL